MIFRLIILIVIASLFHIGELFAQTDTVKISPKKAPVSQMGTALDSTQDDFEQLKYKISKLLNENRKLESEYQSLERELSKRKKRVQQLEGEVAEVSPENWEEKRERERKVNALKTFYDDVEKLRNDILIKESKVTYLTGQLIDLEDKQRIWKLRVSDLEFQKRELDMNLKMNGYTLHQIQQRHQKEVDDLRRKIQRNLDEERELLSRIAAIEDGSFYTPRKAEILEEENLEFDHKLGALKKNKEFQGREYNILKKKRLIAIKSKEPLIQKKEKERAELIGQVGVLENRADQLNATLEESLKRKVEKDFLMKDFIELQQENEALRTKVEALKDRFGTLSDQN